MSGPLAGPLAVNVASRGDGDRVVLHHSSRADTPQAVIFVAIFFSLLGWTMTGPILPALRAHFCLTASKTGLVTSAFPLGMLAAVFVFPAVSDVVGRKPMIVVSYLCVGCGMCLQALAIQRGFSFDTFLMLRMITGTFAGASAVVKAYLADTSCPERLPEVMAYRESAATCAFIVGPVLGGVLLAASSIACTLFVQSCTSILAGLLVLLFLKESPWTGRKQQQQQQTPTVHGCSETKLSETECPISHGQPWVPIITLTLVSCAYNFGQSFFDGFFPVLCADRFGLLAPAIGSTQTTMAVIVFIVTASLYGTAVRRLGLAETAILGLLLIASGVGLTGASPTWLGVLFGVLLYAVGIPLFSPSMATMFARCAPEGRRGLVLGVDSTVASAGRILAPAALGMLYEVSPSRAFGSVGLVVALGALVMFVEKSVLSRASQ